MREGRDSGSIFEGEIWTGGEETEGWNGRQTAREQGRDTHSVKSGGEREARGESKARSRR